jgi:hypothetical protein
MIDLLTKWFLKFLRQRFRNQIDTQRSDRSLSAKLDAIQILLDEG